MAAHWTHLTSPVRRQVTAGFLCQQNIDPFLVKLLQRYRLESAHNNQLLSSIYAYTHALLTDTYIHTNIHIHTSIRTYIHTYIQGKAIPVEAWRCSWVSRNLSLPEFLDNGQKKVARLWAVRKAASNSSPSPQEIPLKIISVGVWVDYRIGGTKWKKNRTLDLMVWSTVPQPTSSPRGTHNLQYIYRYLCIHGHIGLYIGAHTQIFDMW